MLNQRDGKAGVGDGPVALRLSPVPFTCLPASGFLSPPRPCRLAARRSSRPGGTGPALITRAPASCAWQERGEQTALEI